MATKPKSRWDTAEDDPADLARLKAEKESRKHLKAQKDRRKAEAAATLATSTASTSEPTTSSPHHPKRRKLDEDASSIPSSTPPPPPGPLKLLRFEAPEIAPCRHVDNYELLNHIEEGSYGIVSRARDTSTGEIVALKKLKLEREKDGFPITSLREIQTLMICKHPNIINLREVVMGDRLDQVYLVMDFIEHDLKTLFSSMQEPFLPSETKTLLLQLISATHFMHTNWILHRDLKTSNLLMNNRGQIKVADFGLARLISDPPQKHLTRLVVTLWYRSPELLLGAKEYGREVDMWSIGCIFAELLTKEPIFKGTTEVDQISKIFTLLGVPTEASWPGYRRLPHAKSLTFPRTPATTGSQLRSKFPMLTNQGFDLLSRLLCLDPARRITAEEVLKHEYFREEPRPKREEMFPTFPSKAGGEKRRRRDTPEAPRGGEGEGEGGWGEEGQFLVGAQEEEVGGGFMLKLGR
ncbi:Pkinase-domain-containing protein [Terfezia boudieri ATCC MYA-4762]|uniref:cyclin-dependent kinase n=1 Tax=Terfezia boudieri ATCC MYA-4762 TaxID=1051890 RepID=A0A3N4LKM3_9PEZI|nr:Pkinase-domain-containing protein [Terfezia boudieri ATCC MYA-4762]